MATKIQSLLQVILPRRVNPKGNAVTSTFNSAAKDRILTGPTYREHLSDLFTTRVIDDSRKLLQTLFTQDPDVSAAVNAFLTVANTDPIYVARDVDGVPNREAQKALNQILLALTTRFDYSKGFQLRQSLRATRCWACSP